MTGIEIFGGICIAIYFAVLLLCVSRGARRGLILVAREADKIIGSIRADYDNLEKRVSDVEHRKIAVKGIFFKELDVKPNTVKSAQLRPTTRKGSRVKKSGKVR